MDYYTLNDGVLCKCNLLEWARWRSDHPQECIVAQTQLPEAQAEVSTVFIGADNVLFETMILGGDRDEEQYRDDTREAALKRHHELVAALTPDTRCPYCHSLKGEGRHCPDCGAAY